MIAEPVGIDDTVAARIDQLEELVAPADERYLSPRLMNVLTRSRVTPAVGSTMLIISPARALSRLLLPTFGRPIIATTGNPMDSVSD
jgi:hypothetical protein